MATARVIDCDLATGVCPRCGFKGDPHWRRNCTGPLPPPGPGDHLHSILQSIGLSIGTLGCGGTCQEWIDRMNAWGPAGSREHRAEIIAHLEEQKDAASLVTKGKAFALAVAKRLPLDIPGLVDLAISRAEQAAP